MKSRIEPRTLKGFRDFLPQQARKRQYVIDTLKEVFESYGFEPLETPALEYEEILMGKYGDEGDKLMYRFEDNGGRRVALRYDQTVPLARVIAQYQNITLPLKRYQIQSVWRAENTQKGRYREFLQCDADTVGSISLLADAETIVTAAKSLEALGFKKYKIAINDRQIFKEFQTPVISIVDKLKKVGTEKVKTELKTAGFSPNILREILNKKPTAAVEQIISYCEKMGVDKKAIKFDPTLARGLDYYTEMIFELEVEGYSAGSVCGGGRYDNLIGMFAGKPIPAVGFAFGFDRIIEAMEEQKLFPKRLNASATQILVTVFPGYKEQSIQLVSTLRNKGINAELYLEDTKLDKQLKYADKKNIPYIVIIGPNEIKDKTLTLKDMKTQKQESVTQDELLERFSRKCDCGEECGNNCDC